MHTYGPCDSRTDQSVNKHLRATTVYTQLTQTGFVLLLLPFSTVLGFTLYDSDDTASSIAPLTQWFLGPI